jgi:hypothetical protein
MMVLIKAFTFTGAFADVYQVTFFNLTEFPFKIFDCNKSPIGS